MSKFQYPPDKGLGEPKRAFEDTFKASDAFNNFYQELRNIAFRANLDKVYESSNPCAEIPIPSLTSPYRNIKAKDFYMNQIMNAKDFIPGKIYDLKWGESSSKLSQYYFIGWDEKGWLVLQKIDGYYQEPFSYEFTTHSKGRWFEHKEPRVIEGWINIYEHTSGPLHTDKGGTNSGRAATDYLGTIHIRYIEGKGVELLAD